MSEFLKPESIISQLNLSPGMRVSDFGCGSGHMTMEIAKRIGKEGLINAIDVQTSALEAVKAKAVSLGLGNINTVHADLEVLGGTTLDTGSQDMIFIAQALYQSQKKEDILKEASRILKPSGLLAMVEWKKGGGGFGPPDDLRTSEDELKRIADSAGLAYQSQLDAGVFHVGMIFKKKD
jgi:ubiquinone/menaquinone biosynthesis C-methylase UbiE